MVSSKASVKFLYSIIDSVCRKKSLDFPKRTGRPPSMSFAAELTVVVQFILSRRSDFKTFFDGLDGEVLRKLFPKMTCYSSFLRHLSLISNTLAKSLQCSGKKLPAEG